MIRVHGELRPLAVSAAHRQRHQARSATACSPRRRRRSSRRTASSTSRSASRACHASAATSFCRRARSAARSAPFRIEIPPLEKLGLPHVGARDDEAAARPRPRDRADRQRQVDDARGDDRQDQQRRATSTSSRSRTRSSSCTTHKSALVNQREVFADTQGFAPALKHVLRQDPDIVLIGEMRDLETIEAALVVAETGHLVFSTLHTNSRGADHQPRHRRVPAAPAGAGARAALARAPGRHLAAADAARGRPGPLPRRRDHDPQRRHPEPHPRGEGAPDLLADAGRTAEVRHADDEPIAPRSRTRAN